MRERWISPGSVATEKLDELDDSKKYTCRLFCSECHTQLRETRVMTKDELRRGWTMIVMGSGFSAGRCPGCKSSTFSDLNIHTDLFIFEAP